MLTVLRADGFWFFFYANEGNEPAHIHVRKAEGEAKFWLTPDVVSRGYAGLTQPRLRCCWR
jgi:hypothetical protein